MTPRERALQRAETLLRREDCHTLAVELQLLLPLPLWKESDLYALMETDARRLAKTGLPCDFAMLRGEARGQRLDELYDHLSARLMGANVRSLAQRERELRMRLPLLMADVQQLLRLAKSLGKRTIVYDGGMSLLTNGDVQQMLTDRGAELPDEVYIDHMTGGLFDVGTLTMGHEQARLSWRHITVPSPVGGMRRKCAREPAAAWLGWCTMQALTALHPGGALGMHLFSQAIWLADECCRAGLERVVFLGGEASLMRQAFDAVCRAMTLPLEAAQAEISQRAAMPLHFRHANDLLALTVLADVNAHTPRTLLDMFAPVVDVPRAAAVLQEWGFLPNAPLDEAGLMRFIDVFRTRLFDEERFAAYRGRASKHLAPLCTGSCALFCAPEDFALAHAVADVVGADMPVFALHTVDALPEAFGMDVRALYGHTPAVRAGVRVHLLSAPEPECLRYGARGPVQSEQTPCQPEPLATMQADALTYVRTLAELFGRDLSRLVFRPQDGCAAFERFLDTASTGAMTSLCGTDAAGKALCRAWRRMQCASAGERPLRVRLRGAVLPVGDAVKQAFTLKKRRQ